MHDCRRWLGNGPQRSTYALCKEHEVLSLQLLGPEGQTPSRGCPPGPARDTLGIRRQLRCFFSSANRRRGEQKDQGIHRAALLRFG